MAKRIKLKSKVQTVDNTKKIKNYLSERKNYYSEFCLTDNNNYAFFNIKQQFLVDKGIHDVLSFNLREDDLQMVIDRIQIKPSLGGDFVTFENMGMIERKLYNFVINEFPNCLFCKVTNWQGKISNRLIVVLADLFGKPLVMLKTIKKGD